jgi:hypothetical protein
MPINYIDIESGEKTMRYIPPHFCVTHSRFIIQAVLSATVVGFSITVIMRNQKTDNSVNYSLISSIIGYWLPSPSIPRKPKQPKA